MDSCNIYENKGVTHILGTLPGRVNGRAQMKVHYEHEQIIIQSINEFLSVHIGRFCVNEGARERAWACHHALRKISPQLRHGACHIKILHRARGSAQAGALQQMDHI